MRTMQFFFIPRVLGDLQRKCYISKSCVEKRLAMGSPLAQPRLDTLEPNNKTHAIVNQPDECNVCQTSEPVNEDDHGCLDKVNREDSAWVKRL